MSRKQFVFLVCLITGINTFGAPGTYYNSIDTNQTCTVLKTNLFHLLASNTTVIPYSQVDNYYNLTDLKPAESGGGDAIVDRYCTENPNGLDYCVFRYATNFCLTTPSDTNQCVCYNKEHTFPKSWFGTTVYPMYSDLHFVWPADNRINLYKSNFPIGYAKNAYFSSRNGTVVGQSDGTKNFGYTGTNVFEPIDSFKGDFARAYLYVITRYEDSLPFWTGRSTAGNVIDGSKYPGFKSWILQLCVKWSKMDPPSAFEMQRNDAVYSIQGNRNPYVDHPNWVEKVFGVDGNSAGCVSLGVKKNKEVEFELYPNPAQSMVYVKLQKALQQDATLEIMDISGRTISSQKVQPSQEIQKVEVSNLAKGIYFINILYNGSENVSKFIKE